MDPAAQLTNAVTERVIIPVRGSIDAWREPLKFLLQALQKQPGYLRTRWGPWREDPQKLELLTGWTTIEASETWKRSPDHTDAMTRLAPVMAGHPTSTLLQFRPLIPQAVVNSPLVETLTFDDCREPDERMREIVERARTMRGCNGVASGFSLGRGGGGAVSTHESNPTGGDGGGRTFIAAVGWAGIEASRAADKAAYTGGMKTESHHVDYAFPVEGFGGL
ncbi:hypothetical protein CPLU01_15041 [Colletotrichum plurivorum]|uniref:ABM domain-containing protein n=1 Tax=Colletotrichum plurivorum TaxID=2175906 RepID=A0A8H6JFR3_9PEZI|nr:hypothetical protein CPLU01_15041 [Colletotrichum plurivorum]